MRRVRGLKPAKCGEIAYEPPKEKNDSLAYLAWQDFRMTNPTDPSLGPDKPETSPRQSTALVLFVTTMVQTLVTMNVVIPAAIAPEVAQAHGVPSSLIGLQIGLVYGGAMILSTLSGTLVRRWGAIRTSQTALILSAFGGAMMAMPSP